MRKYYAARSSKKIGISSRLCHLSNCATPVGRKKKSPRDRKDLEGLGSRRLGAKVEAYDVRPAVKEQVHSMGAKFVELPLEAGDAEDKGGYAKAQDEAFYRRQREMMIKVVAASDVVVTTALRRTPADR